MPLETALLFLLQKLGHGHKKVVLNYYETEQVWDKEVLKILQEEKLLSQAEDAKTIICTGCEKLCEKAIQTRTIPLSTVSFSSTPSCPERFMYLTKIHCDTFDQWIDVIPRQWQLTNQMLIDWLTNYLNLEPPKEANRVGVTQIGTLTLNSERYALALGTSDELALQVNGNVVSMSELFSVSEGGAIEVDTDLIEQHKRSVVDKVAPAKPKKLHSAKQQVSQAESQKMYIDWQKAYQKLRKKYPNKSSHSDSWAATEISKLPIANKRHKDTIRKHMIA